MAEEKKLSGPDFAQGVSLTEFTDGGMLQGHAKGESILVVRRGDACFAIGASCTHYGAPLAEGLVVGDTVGNEYVVLDGIKPGDHVILSGLQFLQDGAPVAEMVQGADGKAAPAGGGD